MLHWWRVSGSTALELHPCTNISAESWTSLKHRCSILWCDPTGNRTQPTSFGGVSHAHLYLVMAATAACLFETLTWSVLSPALWHDNGIAKRRLIKFFKLKSAILHIFPADIKRCEREVSDPCFDTFFSETNICMGSLNYFQTFLHLISAFKQLVSISDKVNLPANFLKEIGFTQHCVTSILRSYSNKILFEVQVYFYFNKIVIWIQICAILNHRKKMKAEPSRLISQSKA